MAVAAAWTTAVVVGRDAPPDTISPVDFDTRTFPLSLAPEPAGVRPVGR